MANRFYDDEGCPTSCYKCGGDWLKEHITSQDEAHVYEHEIICVWCGTVVGYWAYGGYDGSYIFEEET